MLECAGPRVCVLMDCMHFPEDGMVMYGTDCPHTEAGSPGCCLDPVFPIRIPSSGICFITVCHAKGFSCSIFQANFRNLFSPSDIDFWGSLQAAWNEKSMVTAAEWAPVLH